ncbi:MAG: hypothetical protein SGI77_01305 [Pirellulaceae bacterium]|nr:hypothetical protein [Pirellulaceae bacterium]
MTHDEMVSLFEKATASIYAKNFGLAFECFDRLVQHGNELDSIDLKYAQIGRNLFDPNGDKDEAVFANRIPIYSRWFFQHFSGSGLFD